MLLYSGVAPSWHIESKSLLSSYTTQLPTSTAGLKAFGNGPVPDIKNRIQQKHEYVTKHCRALLITFFNNI